MALGELLAVHAVQQRGKRAGLVQRDLQRDEFARPHLAQRAAQSLDDDGQRRLLRLLRWRDAYARDNDRPRTWILENDFAVALARDPPADLASLQRKLDAQAKAPRGLAAAVWDALDTPLVDELESPPMRNDERDKQALRQLQAAVAARSAELGLPDGVLASRRWLEQLMDSRARNAEAWPGPLAGWRRGELESVLPAAAPQH